jgi:hypothetical protein
MLQSGQTAITTQNSEKRKRILFIEYERHVQFLFGTVTNKIYIVKYTILKLKLVKLLLKFLIVKFHV